MTALPLFATLTALICGPLLYAVARRQPAFTAFLDGFVLVSIAGLVLLEVVPGAYGEGGIWSLAFLLVGAIGPSVVEHTLYRARREAHLATLALAVLGLLLHSVGDGVALAPGPTPDHGHAHEALGIAVVVHSIPVGLVVWWVMAPVFGRGLPALTLLLMCAGSVVGFVFGPELSLVLGTSAFAWFQALVAGSILHVVFGRPHLDEDSEHRDAPAPFEGFGNLVALAGLVALDRLDPHAAELHAFLDRYWNLGLAFAPLVLLAFLIGGWMAASRSPPAERLKAALRLGLVDGVDRAAAWVLAGLAALALLVPRLVQETGSWTPAGAAIHLACLALLAIVFLMSLLRCGGRRWVSGLFEAGGAAAAPHRH